MCFPCETFHSEYLDRSLASAEMETMAHYEALITQFLSVDSEMNGGRAAWLWPMILSTCYPSLAGATVTQMLLSLVARGLRNQSSGCNGELLDFCEVFAGAGWLTYEMLASGFHGTAFDYVMHPSHDALSAKGLRLLLNAICQVRKFGLVWLGTPCSSFTVLCRYQSRRTAMNSFLGEEDGYNFVKVGNYLMECSALVFFLCYLLSIWVTLEQPKNSCMLDCPSLKGVAYYTRAIRYFTFMGSFEGPSMKPLQLLSTWESMSRLQRPRPQMMAAESLVVRSETGFTGRKDLLRQSQMYTQAFGRAVSQICQEEWQ